MDYTQIAQNIEDAPVDTNPEGVWVEVEVLAVEEREEAYTGAGFGRLHLDTKIVQSQADASGRQARGRVFIDLDFPPKGHNQAWKARVAGDAIGCLLAPEITKPDERRKEGGARLNAGGGANALIGKRALIQTKTNDGCQKKVAEGKETFGECPRHEGMTVVREKGQQKPQTEANAWAAATSEKIAALINKPVAGNGAAAKSW